MKSFPWGLTFDPALNSSHPSSILRSESLWMSFGLLTFLSSHCFSRKWWKLQACVCVISLSVCCVCVCVTQNYSILALAPALWSLSFFCSCPVVYYKMVEVSPYKRLRYYLPHFWKHGVQACLLFDLTYHNIVMHWVSKQLSKAIFSWRKNKWNPLKSPLCRFGYCTTVGHSCRRKRPIIPTGGTSKLFAREKHECKLNMREPGQRAKSNAALRRTLKSWSNSWCLWLWCCAGSQPCSQTSLSKLSWELAHSNHQGKLWE